MVHFCFMIMIIELILILFVIIFSLMLQHVPASLNLMCLFIILTAYMYIMHSVNETHPPSMDLSLSIDI